MGKFTSIWQMLSVLVLSHEVDLANAFALGWSGVGVKKLGNMGLRYQLLRLCYMIRTSDCVLSGIFLPTEVRGGIP
ncbi:uncharacterized protein BO66DRAFT_215601 [Aspergillus aculeatinus CBS 121060]|uniref:Uncharacterized protein n=1 Tax=Aspergillus aculeatinus CBS 121060 TaxID=1448322 RepID=A0ACD1GUX3_9EURO|nr:hypothetical protein BO66DRAFT_215601 [Aspergillus aculeatinus CBS 121060]RAH65137.1 hypothetical protein BO66DRAFT_215601 [Aspergillus aculeatinus CBS 121060]